MKQQTNLILNLKDLESQQIDIDEFLLMYLVYKDTLIFSVLQRLVKEGKIRVLNSQQFAISDEYKSFIERTINTDVLHPNNVDKLTILANKLRDLFPKGIKDGTNNTWRGSEQEIIAKLLKLEAKFKINLDIDECVAATQSYIDSFNGNFRLMQTLKYFILKNISVAGELEIKSELLAYIDFYKQGSPVTRQDDFLSHLK